MRKKIRQSRFHHIKRAWLHAIIPDNRTKIHGNVIIIICDSEFLNTLTALFLVVKMSINNWARKREANKCLKKIKKQFT